MEVKTAWLAREFLERSLRKEEAGASDEAIQAVNTAIYSAPFGDHGSSLLPLCFAKRSRMFFNEKRYFECIRDVDTALIYGRPPEGPFPIIMLKTLCYLEVDRPRLALKSLKFDLKFFNVDGHEREVKKLKKAARMERARVPVDVERNTVLRPRYADREEMLRRMKGMIPTDGRKLGDVVVSSAVSLRRQDDEEIFFATRDVQAGKKAVP
jgi:hypothetical protein